MLTTVSHWKAETRNIHTTACHLPCQAVLTIKRYVATVTTQGVCEGVCTRTKQEGPGIRGRTKKEDFLQVWTESPRSTCYQTLPSPADHCREQVRYLQGPSTLLIGCIVDVHGLGRSSEGLGNMISSMMQQTKGSLANHVPPPGSGEREEANAWASTPVHCTRERRVFIVLLQQRKKAKGCPPANAQYGDKRKRFFDIKS